MFMLYMLDELCWLSHRDDFIGLDNKCMFRVGKFWLGNSVHKISVIMFVLCTEFPIIVTAEKLINVSGLYSLAC